VTSFCIVERKVFLQSQTSFQYVHIRTEIDILLFDASPEPFDEDIVQIAPTSIHADLNSVRFQYTCEPRTGEMTALVGVEYIGRTRSESFFQALQTEVHFQRVGYLPADHISRIPVDDGYEVGEAFLERYVGDIGTPDLIRLFDSEIPKEVWIDRVLRVSQTEVFLRVERADIHYVHECPDFLPPDVDMVCLIQFLFDAPVSIERMIRIYGIDDVHDALVFLGDPDRMIVQGRARDIEQFALSFDGDVIVVFLDQVSPFSWCQRSTSFF
jgi:hypothetical protein